MSTDRQPDAEALVRSSSVGFRSGYHWRDRRALWGELLWAEGGVITVVAGDALWVVPLGQALWLPAGTVHGVRLAGRGVLRSVYVHPGQAPITPAHVGVVRRGSLLRALLRRVLHRGVLMPDRAPDVHLALVLCDEVRAGPGAPVALPMPTDARARRAAEHFQQMLQQRDPEHGRLPSAEALAPHAGASVRTLERCFRGETGMTLGAWCLRARVVFAMTRLADGASVTVAGLDAGYATTSAFVASFRRIAGVTPGRYARSVEPSMDVAL